MVGQARTQLEAEYGPEWQAQHGIEETRSAEYFCTKCEKQLPDLCRVQEHLGSRRHKSRIWVAEYLQDPLAHVPYPHRRFAEVVQGQPFCMLCRRVCDENHWNSSRHTNRLSSPGSFLYGEQLQLLNHASNGAAQGSQAMPTAAQAAYSPPASFGQAEFVSVAATPGDSRGQPLAAQLPLPSFSCGRPAAVGLAAATEWAMRPRPLQGPPPPPPPPPAEPYPSSLHERLVQQAATIQQGFASSSSTQAPPTESPARWL